MANILESAQHVTSHPLKVFHIKYVLQRKYKKMRLNLKCIITSSKVSLGTSVFTLPPFSQADRLNVADNSGKSFIVFLGAIWRRGREESFNPMSTLFSQEKKNTRTLILSLSFYAAFHAV